MELEELLVEGEGEGEELDVVDPSSSSLVLIAWAHFHRSTIVGRE